MIPPVGNANGAEGRRARHAYRIVIAGVLVAVFAIIVLGAVEIASLFGGKVPMPSECQVSVDSSQYVLDQQQAANATTITAVGKQFGLPDHAVTIALATALQESQLYNVAHGDRDSVGLFQQRPSQGWGTPTQLMNPRFAAAAFFHALVRVPGWQSRPVTNAAQAVQHSNAPDAYATWEPLARLVAIATTGEVPASLSCQFSLTPSKTRPESPVSAMTQELGPSTLDKPVPATRGWMIASWLVGHAEHYRITSIRFAAKEWKPSSGWRPTRQNESVVRITQSAAAA